MTPERWTKEYDYRPQRAWRGKPVRKPLTPSQVRLRLLGWAAAIAFSAVTWYFVFHIMPMVDRFLDARRLP